MTTLSQGAARHPPSPPARAGATTWLKYLRLTLMTRPPPSAAWEEEMRLRDLEIADWLVWASVQRLLQISREIAVISYELNHFEDSFTMQLVQIQQHVRTTRRRREGPVRAALVERARAMSRLSRTLERVTLKLRQQAQMIARIAEEAWQEAPFLPETQDA